MGQSQQSKIINAKMKAKEWQWQLKSEAKNLDKEIKKIQQEELKIQKEMQAQAAKNHVSTVQTLAKQIVRSRKAIKRLEKTKASMHAVNLQITTSMATMSTTGSLMISADVMAKMNKIANTDGVSDVMDKMKLEMARCGAAEDAMEQTLADSDEEEEVATEMQKVLEEMALDVAQFGPLARSAAEVSVPAAAEPVALAPAPKALAQPVAAGGPPTQVPPHAPSVQQAPAPQVPFAPPAQPPVNVSASVHVAPPATGGSVAPGDYMAPFGGVVAPTPPGGYVAPPPASAATTSLPADDDLMARLAALKK